MAEVDGNRTHHTPQGRVHGFEDQGSHQTPVTSVMSAYQGRGAGETSFAQLYGSGVASAHGDLSGVEVFQNGHDYSAACVQGRARLRGREIQGWREGGDEHLCSSCQSVHMKDDGLTERDILECDKPSAIYQ